MDYIILLTTVTTISADLDLTFDQPENQCGKEWGVHASVVTVGLHAVGLPQGVVWMFCVVPKTMGVVEGIEMCR